MIKSSNSQIINIINIGIISLLLGTIMQTTNILFFVIGIFICTVYLFYKTLRRNDIFSFVMVIYFCNLFPYQGSRGGGFNYVAILNILLYIILSKRKIFEIKGKNKKLHFLITVWVISSITGWLLNFVGSKIELVLSVFSFAGVIGLLLIASHLYVDIERIVIFLKINLFISLYALIASLNSFLDIIPGSVMLPKWAINSIESGGVIGVSPMHGQHSLMLAIMFITFYLIGLYTKNRIYNRGFIILGVLISIINVFSSISKAVLLLLIFGIIFVAINQARIININFLKQIKQLILIILLSIIIFFIINKTGLDFVFERLRSQSERNLSSGSIASYETIIDGSAINRSQAFGYSYEKYRSKDSWFVGYGWGLKINNRHAFYTDIETLRGTAHSQIFAVLFLFGWFGFFAFWIMHLYGIWLSLKCSSSFLYPSGRRIFALATSMMILVLILHGVTADNISIPGYFGSTMIILGLSFANLYSEQKS